MLLVSEPSSAPKRRTLRISHVARSSFLIAAFFAVDKALGLLRLTVIIHQFGLSEGMDAFNAANNLPDLLFALISGGALSIAFIPVLSQYLEREGRDGLWSVFSRVANLAFLITGAIAVIIAIFAAPLVRAELGIAPGLRPELQSLVAELMRLNLVATMIFSLSGLISAGLQSNQHFLLPALAPILYDVGQIFGALVLAPEEGIRIAGFQLPTAGLGVRGLVYGVVLGAALHLAIQIPGLIRYRFRWTPRLGIKHPGVRRVIRLMGPRILTIGAFQLIFIVQDNLASRLGQGPITALNYGWLVMQIPETVIATALGIAILPTLSELFARGDQAGLEAAVARALRVLLALTLPAAVLLMLTIRPLMSVFPLALPEIDLVVWAARAYLLGLVGHSLLEIVARTFYARQSPIEPVAASIINARLFIFLGLLLFVPLGATGIALSNSLVFTLEALLLLAMLAPHYPKIVSQGRTLVRVAIGSGIAGLVAFGMLKLFAASGLLAAFTALGAGALVTIPFIWPELRQLVSL
jgi:putative peptidoglycan lipid II flippase